MAKSLVFWGPMERENPPFSNDVRSVAADRRQGLVTNIDLKTSASKARQHLGYMAQKFSLYGNLSVHQNLMFFSGAYGLDGQASRQK